MEVVRAILIDPYQRTVAECKVENTLHGFYQAIGCDLVEAIYPFGVEGEFIYVDEEGLLGGQSCGFIMPNGYQIMGRGLVLGSNRYGETVSTNLAVSAVRELILDWIGEPDLDLDAMVEKELLNSNPLYGQFG